MEWIIELARKVFWVLTKRKTSLGWVDDLVKKMRHSLQVAL